MRSPVQDLIRLLAEIERQPGVHRREMAEILGVSMSTVTRLLRQARERYQLRITRDAGPKGVYVIESWGLLDRERVMIAAGTDKDQ